MENAENWFPSVPSVTRVQNFGDLIIRVAKEGGRVEILEELDDRYRARVTDKEGRSYVGDFTAAP